MEMTTNTGKNKKIHAKSARRKCRSQAIKTISLSLNFFLSSEHFF